MTQPRTTAGYKSEPFWFLHLEQINAYFQVFVVYPWAPSWWTHER